MSGNESAELGQVDVDPSARQVCANGICMQTTVVEAKLDEGNIQEAESALRDGLSLNFEVSVSQSLCLFFLCMPTASYFSCNKLIVIS